jgi:hypothetical protein
MDDTNLNSGLSKTRIEALTDGIFAIAMTLMVFDIKVPAVAQMNQLNLRHELIQLWPRFLAYVISFVMLGVYWVGHHNQYHYIRSTDRPLLWINGRLTNLPHFCLISKKPGHDDCRLVECAYVPALHVLENSGSSRRCAPIWTRSLASRHGRKLQASGTLD